MEQTDMSQTMRGEYSDLINRVSPDLLRFGFKQRGQEEFIRAGDGNVMQRLALSLREPMGGSVGYVEVFPGFNYPEVELLAATLQGKKVRSGFITCSLNIGLLTPKKAHLEWPLQAGNNIESAARLVTHTVAEVAVPFWDEFSSLENLLARFEADDFRLCRGADWFWRQAAAYCLIGQAERAAQVLKAKLAAKPGLKSRVENALQKISEFARRQ
jgi:hypothetical protein